MIIVIITSFALDKITSKRALNTDIKAPTPSTTMSSCKTRINLLLATQCMWAKYERAETTQQWQRIYKM